MPGRHEGRVAVVTGGAGGIGRGIVERLAAEGASVVIADRDRDRGQALAGMHPALAFNETDVTDEVSVQDCVDRTVERFGRLDVMVNNAGIIAVAPVVDLDLGRWRRLLDINLTGVFLGSRAAARQMLAQGHGGVIINASSGGGRRGVPNFAAYCASKAGIIMFSQALAIELAPSGIRVNCYTPGHITTALWDDIVAGFGEVAGSSREETIAAFETTIPWGTLRHARRCRGDGVMVVHKRRRVREWPVHRDERRGIPVLRPSKRSPTTVVEALDSRTGSGVEHFPVYNHGGGDGRTCRGRPRRAATGRTACGCPPGTRVSRRELLRRGFQSSAALALFGGMSSVLTACAGDDGESGSDAGGDAVTGESGGGGTPIENVIYLAEDVPPGLDWDGPSAAIPITQFAIENLYGTLVTFDYEANDEGVLEPDFTSLRGELAESWEQDGLTWTFTLRQGVMSAAGNELTADDVIWTFERAKSVSGAAPVSWFLLNVASVLGTDPLAEDATDADRQLSGEIEKVDDYTVVINQFEPNLLFPLVLGIFALVIVDSTEAQTHATEDDPWAHEYLNSEGSAGFGAYALDSWEKGQQMVLVSNDGWPGGEELRSPTIPAVTLRKVPSASTRTSSLQNGTAQIATNLTSRNYEDLRQDGGDAFVTGILGNENLFIHMNYDVPPWDNIALRQAVAFATPYEDIIENGYFGQAERWRGVAPPSSVGFHEVPLYERNLDRARELLEEAGYPEGEGLGQFGEALQLFYVAEKQDQLQPIAVALQSGLAEVGIQVQLAPIPQSQYGDRQLVQRDLPFALNDQEKPIAPDAGYAIQLFFVSPEAGGLNNMVNYRNEQVDDLWLNQAKVEEDPEARNEILAEAQEILMNDVAWLPVVIYQTQVALNNQLTGFAWDPSNALQLRYFEFES